MTRAASESSAASSASSDPTSVVPVPCAASRLLRGADRIGDRAGDLGRACRERGAQPAVDAAQRVLHVLVDAERHLFEVAGHRLARLLAPARQLALLLLAEHPSTHEDAEDERQRVDDAEPDEPADHAERLDAGPRPFEQEHATLAGADPRRSPPSPTCTDSIARDVSACRAAPMSASAASNRSATVAASASAPVERARYVAATSDMTCCSSHAAKSSHASAGSLVAMRSSACRVALRRRPARS